MGDQMGRPQSAGLTPECRVASQAGARGRHENECRDLGTTKLPTSE